MLVERLKSAIPLIVIVCLAFFAPMKVSAWLFAVLALAMLYFGCAETYTLLAPKNRRLHQSLFTLLGVLFFLRGVVPYLSHQLFINHVQQIEQGEMSEMYAVLSGYQQIFPGLCAIVFLLAFFLTFHQTPDRETVNGILVSLGACVFVAWQLSYLVSIFYYPVKTGDPRLLLFYLILVTKMADTGAFAVGATTAKRPGGNHKLAPLVSPKKSWEGLIGGTVVSLASSLVFVALCHDRLAVNGVQVIGWVDAVIIGIAVSPLGLVGDLAESAIKRSANAKDSGSLPGIGGILDTLDSLLPMGPLFYAYMQLKLAA